MTATLFGFNIARKIGLRSTKVLGGTAAWRGTGVLMFGRLINASRSDIYPLFGENPPFFGASHFTAEINVMRDSKQRLVASARGW